MPHPISAQVDYNEFSDIVENAKAKFGTKFRMTESIDQFNELRLEDVDHYKNVNQTDDRNYIAIRVFSEKFKGDMEHLSLNR